MSTVQGRPVFPAHDKASFWQNLSRPLASGFVLLHVGLMVLWDLPSSPLKDKILGAHILKPVFWYTNGTGLAHCWQMFSPLVPTGSSRFEASITFRDGSRTQVPFQRLGEAGFLEKWFGTLPKRWEGFLYGYQQAWPDAARYLARLYPNPANPPQTVTITRYWMDIPPPSGGSYQPLPSRYEYPDRILMIEYQVRPEDFS